MLIEVRLPNGVPLVDTDCTMDGVVSWVRPPAALPRVRSRLWPLMPRLGDQLTWPAPGAVPFEAPKVIEAWPPLLDMLNRVVWVGSRRPSGVKLTTPTDTWPLVRPGPVTTSLAGTTCASAYHWLGVVVLFRKSICMLRAPPWESASGTVTLKSGLVPVPVVAL